MKIIDGCPTVTKITKPTKWTQPTYYVLWKGEKFTPPAWTTEPKTCKIDYSFDESAEGYNGEMKKLYLNKNVLEFYPQISYLSVAPIQESKTDEFTFKVQPKHRGKSIESWDKNTLDWPIKFVADPC